MKIQKFELTLNNSQIKTFSDPLSIKADIVVRMYTEDPDGFPTFIRDLKKAIKTNTDRYSEIDEVYNALRNAPEKRTKDGQPMPDQSTGQPTKTPWKISDIRKNVTIQRIIEDEMNRLEERGLSETEVDSITIELTPALANHLAKIMVNRLEYSYLAAPHLLETYDKFVDLEAESQKIVKKGKTGEEEDDE